MLSAVNESPKDNDERQARIDRLFEKLDLETTELKRLNSLLTGENLPLARTTKRTVRRKR